MAAVVYIFLFGFVLHFVFVFVGFFCLIFFWVRLFFLFFILVFHFFVRVVCPFDFSSEFVSFFDSVDVVEELYYEYVFDFVFNVFVVDAVLFQHKFFVLVS